MCMSSECESKDADHTTSYDTKNMLVHALYALKQSRQVGPGAVSVSVVATEDDFLVLC